VPILRLPSPEESETACCEARQGKIATFKTRSPEETPHSSPHRPLFADQSSACEGSKLDQSIQNVSGYFERSRHPAVSFTSNEGEVRYPSNLRWICVRCTNSCHDLPGRERNILLTMNDITRITRTTKLTAQEFSRSSRGTAPYERKMKKHNGRCVFLQGSRCSIYGTRPLICRFYPFSLRPLGDKMLEVGFDSSCSGIGTGPNRSERFFRGLITLAKKELSPQ
jgi:Fe-S-cluster containining protein